MSRPQSSNTILMIEPVAFGYNAETGRDNAFQCPSAVSSAHFIAQQARQEMQGLRDALTSAGVRVQSFIGQATCPDDVFPNNWLSTTADKGFIVYPMATPSRSQERRADIMDWLCREGDYHLIANFSPAEKMNRALEGTGVLIQDHVNRRVYVARSLRSDDELLKAWQDKTGYEAIIFDTEDPVAKKPIYHTNVMMHIGSGYAAICPEVIKASDRERVMSELSRTHEVIKLSYAQMLDFCGNALEVSGSGQTKYLALSTRAYEALDEKQRATYLKHVSGFVHAPIPTIEKYGGGSVRCMMCELF